MKAVRSAHLSIFVNNPTLKLCINLHLYSSDKVFFFYFTFTYVFCFSLSLSLCYYFISFFLKFRDTPRFRKRHPCVSELNNWKHWHRKSKLLGSYGRCSLHLSPQNKFKFRNLHLINFYRGI